MPKRTGLPPQEFETLKATLTQQLLRLVVDTAERVKRIMLLHASELARCNKLQMAELKLLLAPCDKGFHLSNMIDKAVLHGEGKMARHLVLNPAMTATKFKKLPKAAKEQLNSGVIPVVTRGRVIHVPAAELTPTQMKQVVSGNYPESGILTPAQQKTMPRYRKPVYHTLTGTELDGRSIIMTWELNTARFKGRVTLSALKALVKKYSSLPPRQA